MGQEGRGAHLRARLKEAARLLWSSLAHQMGEKGLSSASPSCRQARPLPRKPGREWGRGSPSLVLELESDALVSSEPLFALKAIELESQVGTFKGEMGANWVCFGEPQGA